MKIYVKKVDGLQLPKTGTDKSAGYDIISTSEPKIIGDMTTDGSYKRIDYIEYETNLFIAPGAATFHTLIHPRSSISKYNLVLANSVGLIDNDYRGQILCRFKYQWQPYDFIYETIGVGGKLVGKPNLDKIYKKGDAIAQLVLEETIPIDWEIVDDLNQTQRGDGGFGSTTKVLGFNPTPQLEVPTSHKTSLEKLFIQSVGTQVKEKYSEEMKKHVPPQ